MSKIFEIPEIITLTGKKLDSTMEFDDIALAAGNNGCPAGGGSDNGCPFGGGSGNGCGGGGGGIELDE